MHISSLKSQIDLNGFAILPNFISTSTVNHLKNAIAPLPKRPGIRNLHHHIPAVRDLLCSDEVQMWIRAIAPRSFPVRTIFFDKTPNANWKVPWHQDLTICVKKRYDIAGFTGWSTKDGVVHVQPPSCILDRMLTIRLHLDPCGLDNGPLRVLPGTHHHGRLSPEQISHFSSVIEPTTCIVPESGALFMKPLLLHCSSPAENPSHRRVLHIELAAEPLPSPLAWAE